MGDKAGGGGGGGFGGGGGGPFGGGLGGSSGPTPGPDTSGGWAGYGRRLGTLDPKTGAYTMANGEVDAPVGGGYAHAHGPADEWIFRKGRYYKKGTEPPTTATAAAAEPRAPAGFGMAGRVKRSAVTASRSMVDKDGHMLPPGQRELTKDGRGTGRVFANGKEIGVEEAPKAAPPDIPRPGAPPKTEPGMAPARRSRGRRRSRRRISRRAGTVSRSGPSVADTRPGNRRATQRRLGVNPSARRSPVPRERCPAPGLTPADASRRRAGVRAPASPVAAAAAVVGSGPWSRACWTTWSG